jgi:hypothetical protein
MGTSSGVAALGAKLAVQPASRPAATPAKTTFSKGKHRRNCIIWAPGFKR